MDYFKANLIKPNLLGQALHMTSSGLNRTWEKCIRDFVGQEISWLGKNFFLCFEILESKLDDYFYRCPKCHFAMHKTECKNKINCEKCGFTQKVQFLSKNPD